MAAVTPSRSGVSPSSSPRLPSPPPIPEVQFGPKSPGIGDISKELSLDATCKPDEGAARRIRPGTKAADMAMGPPLVPLSQLDSPFQLQEHLKSLYSHLTHTSGSTHTVPISKESALQLATPPQINENESVDRNLWLYELCRFLTQKANVVSIFLMNDSPPCSSQTCPEMRASEWQYLCAVHEPPKSCCAIDYCNHTLDWAANVLTSPKHFPSRLALGGEAGNVIQSMRQLTNIFRRVYRIFAHAWFQHRDVFWSVEATYGLYILFKVVCDEYHLIPQDSYTIPPEAEGSREEADDRSSNSAQDNGSWMQILRKDTPSTSSSDESSAPSATTAGTTHTTGATTRRHKHTPSTGSHVATIAEGQEEEDEEPTSTIAAPKNLPTLEPTTTTVEIPDSPPKSKDASPDHLPKLDIHATVPKYEPRAPEDPTPTGNVEDIDPLSINTQAAVESSSATTANEATKPETPINQKMEDDEGKKFTSPSGGSIRTGGPDVLNAILEHIHDTNDGHGQGHANAGNKVLTDSPKKTEDTGDEEVTINAEETAAEDGEGENGEKEDKSEESKVEKQDT
ncbi:uncharacterized protein Z518_08135 [Rhinocladiella mackenziei CBS 650.93]|uniref:Mob1 family protein n=1 Tax=Rhinocladiella mackenziei CBS 650.93 TaxID=1442369 RepID=A0A0D2IFZ6_9EURO|nr:uncharacterized protein Z518_08135 [Rhinocladiella mackenziei CBS 650.93]KIX02196.1 hypothetical protein Z518_08135 [Rhinocladiella mackenziei CBS 650.93]